MRRLLSISLLLAGAALSVATTPPPVPIVTISSNEVVGPELTVEAGVPAEQTLVVRASAAATELDSELIVSFSAGSVDGAGALSVDLGGSSLELDLPEGEVVNEAVTLGNVLDGCDDPGADGPAGTWEADGTCVVVVPLTFHVGEDGPAVAVLVEWSATASVSAPEDRDTSQVALTLSPR